MWHSGNMNGFRYQVKAFDKGSQFGINGGRISKLWISKDGKTYANYDRSWDMVPTDPAAIEVYESIVDALN